MTTSDLPTHADVQSELQARQLGVDASELHGSLCGYLCGGGQAARDSWLVQLTVAGPDEATTSPDGSLDALYQVSFAQLEDPDLGFYLLLPQDAAGLDERAEALLAWCRGFLGGFGLVGPEVHGTLSAEAREALEDLADIAGSSLSYDETEADEAALIEVAEFVRVAALLLHSDCHQPRDARRLH